MKKMCCAAVVGLIALAYMFYHQRPTAPDQQVVAFLAGVMAVLAALGTPGYFRLVDRLLRETKKMEADLRCLSSAKPAERESSRDEQKASPDV
jgi:hypothetical protein